MQIAKSLAAWNRRRAFAATNPTKCGSIDDGVTATEAIATVAVTPFRFKPQVGRLTLPHVAAKHMLDWPILDDASPDRGME